MSSPSQRDRRRARAGALVAEVRRVLSALLSQEWPADYTDGLQALVNEVEKIRIDPSHPVDLDLARRLLPVVDGLERAWSLARSSHRTAFVQLARALTRLFQIFSHYGIRPDNPLGTEFDPKKHEAIGVRAFEDRPSGIVVDILERGWFLEDVQIRPSKVVVSTRSPGSGQPEPGH